MKRSFTLIELLVVIAIIGILMSMLLPSLSKARSTTRTAVCVSNQKQVGMGIMLYADSNEGKLPGPLWHSIWPSIGWDSFLSGRIAPYVNTEPQIAGGEFYMALFDCPSFTVSEDGSSNLHSLQFMIMGKSETGKYYFGSKNQSHDLQYPSLIAAIEEPSEENSVFEVDTFHRPGSFTDVSQTPRHGNMNKRVGLWWDGHVEVTTKRGMH